MRHPGNSASPYVTASVGSATAATHDQLTAKHLLADADLALYRAKDLGRNRVCTTEEIEPLPGFDASEAASRRSVA